MVGKYFSVRGTSYQFRLAIPAELRGGINRHEFRWVIPVRQRRVAERIAILAYCGCIQIFREAALVSDSKQIDWAKLARDHFKKCVDRFRADAPGHLSLTNDEKKSLVREWDLDCAELAKELAGDFFYDATTKRAKEVISENGYDWESLTTLDKHKATEAMVRAEMEGQRAAIHELEKPFAKFEPTDDLLRPQCDTHKEISSPFQGADGQIQVKVHSKVLVSSAIKEFLAEEAADPRWTEKTRSENIGHLKWFSDFVGESALIGDITRNTVFDFKTQLMKVRKKVTTSTPFSECLTQDENDRIHIKTAKKKLSTVKQFFRWAANTGKIADDPANTIVFQRKSTSSDEKIKDFTPEQLVEILHSPAFMGCESTKNEMSRSKPGGVISKDEFYWLFLLLMFTGARLNELVSLPLKNVYLEEHPHLRLSAKEQSLKTVQSERIIPIHPQLLNLGFAEFIAKRRTRYTGKDAIWLFNYSVADPMGAWSKRFNRYLDAIGFSDPRYRMHSFRHTFATALRNAGVPEGVHRTITGHTKKDVAETYGSAPNVKKLSEYVASVDLGVPQELWDELRDMGGLASPSEPE